MDGYEIEIPKYKIEYLNFENNKKPEYKIQKIIITDKKENVKSKLQK